MPTLMYPLCFGNHSANSYSSEANYLDALRRKGRPMRDASFKSRQHVTTRSIGITVSGITIAAGTGCPMHLETIPEPQYTLLILSDGSISVEDGHTAVHATGQSIIRSSYQRHMTLDFDHSSAITIRSSIPLLLDALNVEGYAREQAAERLLNTDVEQIPTSIRSVDYYGTVRSVLRMIDAADCNESQLERLGLHKLLTGLIADLTLKVDRRIGELVAS